MEQKRQNISELLKMHEIQESLEHKKLMSKFDTKSQSSKINFSQFDYQSASVNTKTYQPRKFQKVGDQYGHKADKKVRPKTGLNKTTCGLSKKLNSRNNV